MVYLQQEPRGAKGVDMTRVVVVVAILCAAGAWLYWQGGKDTRNSNRETQVEREKDIENAIDNDCDGAHWSDRLRGCE